MLSVLGPQRFAWSTAVVVLLAGCVGGAAGDLGDPSRLAGAEDGVVVTGLVISEELFGVAGANVTLVGHGSVVTGPTGRFEMPGVPEGEYEINVTADGYEPTGLTVQVSHGLEDLRIPLKGIPGLAPYALTVIHDGFTACAISAVYSAGPFPPVSGFPCPFGAPKGGPKVEVAETWAAGVYEMSWRTREDMIFASSVATEDTSRGRQRASCITGTSRSDWCPAMIWGASPLRIFVRPDDADYAAKYALNGKDTWPGGENFTSWLFSSYSGYAQREINGTFYNQCVLINRQFNIPEKWGCPFGVGYALGIKVTYYHTTFYLQPPAVRLEDFTALPDN